MRELNTRELLTAVLNAHLNRASTLIARQADEQTLSAHAALIANADTAVQLHPLDIDRARGAHSLTQCAPSGFLSICARRFYPHECAISFTVTRGMHIHIAVVDGRERSSRSGRIAYVS